MHPLKVEQPYPLEQWWVAAYSSEVDRQLLGRTILNEKIIMYRTESGEAVALSGICPHRGYPLKDSKLVGDAVQCGYHGFTFDKGGSCTLVPTQNGVPTNSSLRQYPVIERGGLVWIWMDDASGADPAQMPNLEAGGLIGNDWRVDPSPVTTISGRYTLLIDNLLDLSHASFIHHDTIPGSEAVAQIPAELIETTASLNVQRKGLNIPSNPYVKLQFPEYDGPVDQHFDAEYFQPSYIVTGGKTYPAGSSEQLGTQLFVHCITPETPTSTHYWVMTTRNFQLENEILSKANLDMGDRIQPQDVEAIEKIEINLQESTGKIREVSARVDTGALKVRHRLEKQINAEAEARK